MTYGSKVSKEEQDQYSYENSAGARRAHIVDDSGNSINPSTREKQDDTITAIEAISGLQRSTDLDGLGKVSIGTTATVITFAGTPESIIITADKDNTGTLYIGKSDVTNAGLNAITFLDAGDEISLEYDDTTNALYIVSDTASQYYWGGALL